jgi:hypothetical protein
MLRKKNAVFWDVSPCKYCVNRRFGGMYRLNLHLSTIYHPSTQCDVDFDFELVVVGAVSRRTRMETERVLSIQGFG